MLVRSLVCLIVSSSLFALVACSGSPNNGGLTSGLTEDGDAGTKKKATKKAEAEDDEEQGKAGDDKDTVTDPDQDPKAGTCALTNVELKGTCGECLSKSCCTQWKACDKNPECLDLYQCAGACEDDACVEACVQKFPNGVKAVIATGDCRKAKCSTECK